MHDLIWPAFNLAVLVIVLVYFLRAPVRGAVAARHASLRDELHRVREQLRAAQAKHEEFSAKLAATSEEFAALREQVRADAQAAKATILSEARRLSATIVSDSRASADGLYSDLRKSLYADLGAAVLERAESLLRDRLTGDDRAKIRQDFSRQLENVQ